MGSIIVRIAAGALILLLAFAIKDGLSKSGGKPESEPPVQVAPLVDVIDLVPGDARFDIRTQGTVVPAAQTQITSEVSGAIVSMSPLFVAGGAFKAGETLVQIDPTLFEASVTQAEAIVRQRQAEYDGIKKLDAKNYRSKIDLAGAEAALASAKADLVRARNDLDKSRVRLPYDGIVRARNVDVGQFLTPGAVLGTAFSSERVEIRLPLGQSDLSFLDLPEVRDGGEIRYPVTLSGRYRGRAAEWSASIVRTEATIDESNRVTYAVAEVTDPYRQQEGATGVPLPVGTFVGATITGRTYNDVLTVPRSALYRSGQLVFVNDESLLQLRDVELIRSDRDRAFIDAGAIDERRLVVTRLETPVNGQQVRVVGDETATAGAESDGAVSAE